jgi:hypothetical protein
MNAPLVVPGTTFRAFFGAPPSATRAADERGLVLPVSAAALPMSAAGAQAESSGGSRRTRGISRVVRSWYAA